MSKLNAWSNSWPVLADYTHFNGVVGQYTRASVLKPQTNSMNGRTLPGFRKLIARHQSATTGLVKTSNTAKFGFGQGFTVVKLAAGKPATLSEWGKLGGVRSTLPALDWSSVTSVQDKATAIFLKKVHKVNESGFSGQVFAAEFGKAVRQLRHPFLSLRAAMFDYLGRLKTKSKDRRFRALTTPQKLAIVGDSWLEFSFGVLPTLSDIESAAKLLDSLGNLDRFVKLRAIAVQDTGKGDAPTQWYGINSSTKFDVYTKNLTSVSCLIVGEVYRPMSMVSPMGFVDKARLDFAEFVPTVWELIPYSWFVDYLTNVGDVLETLTVDRTTIAWNSRTTVQTGNSIITGRFDSAYQARVHGNNYLSSGGDFGLTTRENMRIVRDVSPLTTPALSWDFGVTPWKALNLAALAAAHISTLNRLFRSN